MILPLSSLRRWMRALGALRVDQHASRLDAAVVTTTTIAEAHDTPGTSVDDASAPPASAAVPVGPAATAAPGSSRHRPPRPLRVLRIVEQRPGSGSASRLVISGRMADVCAELDRMVARELAHS